MPNLGLDLGTKRTRKREFLGETDRVVSWDALVGLIAPFAMRTFPSSESRAAPRHLPQSHRH